MTETIEERLARVRAERAEIEAAQAKRDADRALEDELHAEQLALTNEKAIAAAEAKHGRIKDGKIGVLEIPRVGVAIFSRPSSQHFKRWQDSTDNPREQTEVLVKHALVYPDLSVFNEWIEEQPGIVARASDIVCSLAGAFVRQRQGKS